MSSYTPEMWYEHAKSLYESILVELENPKLEEQRNQVLPKLITAYEFFRLLRGEWFDASRPGGLGDYQKELYAMEFALKTKIQNLAANMADTDEDTYYLEKMKEWYSLETWQKESSQTDA